VSADTDTARWMACARAAETERADAIIRDPFAAALAGPAGAQLWHASADAATRAMIVRSIAVRTAVLDELILERVNHEGVDLVLNLAAGLDTRAWRLALPPALRWVDVDRSALLAHKVVHLERQPPACRYRALTADLSNASDRARVLAECADSSAALVVTEGFLVYLSAEQVAALAQALHGAPAVQWWLTDLAGPRALELLQRVWGPVMRGAAFQFAPADSARFFAPLGWREVAFRASRDEAQRLGRATPLPWSARLALWCASAAWREEFRRLSGCALLARAAADCGRA